MHRETIIVSTVRIFKGVAGKIIAFGPSQAASLSRMPTFLPLRFAHSAKIRSSAATPVIDLVHRLFPDRFQSFRSVEGRCELRHYAIQDQLCGQIVRLRPATSWMECQTFPWSLRYDLPPLAPSGGARTVLAEPCRVIHITGSAT
jgi:hypothetical protein